MTRLERLKYLAYLNWCGRGRPANDDWTDWFHAEELRRQNIQHAAYFHWLNRGQPLRDGWVDWFWAEKLADSPGPSIQPWPWAIILCRFSDIPTETKPPAYYEELFTQNGTGGMCDYFRTVSCGALDLTGSRVFGWFAMNHASSEVSQLHFPGDRSVLVQWGLDTAAANGVNLATFRSVLIVQNFGSDHGAAGNGVLIVHKDPRLCEFGFISHEMGHGFGLPHSWAANPDFQYGDGWDVMSWQTTQFTFPYTFKETSGLATVGMNAHNLTKLNAIPVYRTWSPSHPNFSEQVVLDPLGQLPLANHGYLAVRIQPNSTRPIRTNGYSYLTEFRRKEGWDQAIPRDAVLIHEVRTDGNSYIQPTRWQDFVVGDLFMTPDPKVFVQVVGIDPNMGIATLRIWDVPEGSLRREESDPKVFLIQNGAKRWVVSPQPLNSLGMTWADVKVVPDGGLNTLTNGQDLQ